MENQPVIVQKPKPSENSREAGMMCITGIQGVGKTYLSMHIIAEYVKDKPKTKVRGRKCLIFDTNGEYTTEQFAKNGVQNFRINRIAIKDIEAWCRVPSSECRRIDAKALGLKEKQEAVQYLLKAYRNGMLVLEDINTYILSVTFMEEIVGGLVNLRHRAVDVMVSYQSLRPVEPRIFQNSRWIRFHYQSGDVTELKNKIPNLSLFKIAQLLVNKKYAAGDKRFYVYIHSFENKIQGQFTKADLLLASKEYLSLNKKEIREYRQINDCSEEEAKEGKAQYYVTEYWGNK